MAVTIDSHLQDEMMQCLPHSTLVGTLGSLVPGLHRIDRLALMRHKFNSRIYYCLVRKSGEV
jgi:hypothetical protein